MLADGGGAEEGVVKDIADALMDNLVVIGARGDGGEDDDDGGSHGSSRQSALFLGVAATRLVAHGKEIAA